MARSWGAGLTALHVLSAPVVPDHIINWAAGSDGVEPEREARQQLRADVEELGARAAVRIERSTHPVRTIERIAEEIDAGLLITGLARDEPLGRFLLGSIVERLARQPARPVLIVRQRARAMYRRIEVAIDLSVNSRNALSVASRWFEGCELGLFHCVASPMARRTDPHDAATVQASGEVRTRCEKFVNDCGIPRSAFARLTAVEGSLCSALTRQVRKQSIDLVILGAHQSTGLLDRLTGDSLGKLLQWLPCDVMVVPAGPADSNQQAQDA
jgi:nucleotide-binding universal stress UspA family protein